MILIICLAICVGVAYEVWRAVRTPKISIETHEATLVEWRRTGNWLKVYEKGRAEDWRKANGKAD